jgi:hypothetical protein
MVTRFSLNLARLHPYFALHRKAAIDWSRQKAKSGVFS